MQRNPFWEFNRIAASQEILRILWNPKVHYRIQRCPAKCPYPEPAQSSPYPHSNEDNGDTDFQLRSHWVVSK